MNAPQLKIVVTEANGEVITINHSACKPEEMPELCAVVAANDRFQTCPCAWFENKPVLWEAMGVRL